MEEMDVLLAWIRGLEGRHQHPQGNEEG